MNIRMLAMFSAIFFISTIAQAGVCSKTDSWIQEKIVSDSYLERTLGVFSDGLNKIVSSPKTAVTETYNGIKESENPVFGTIEGVMKGAFETASDIVEGALNLGLSIIPEFRGVKNDSEV